VRDWIILTMTKINKELIKFLSHPYASNFDGWRESIKMVENLIEENIQMESDLKEIAKLLGSRLENCNMRYCEMIDSFEIANKYEGT